MSSNENDNRADSQGVPFFLFSFLRNHYLINTDRQEFDVIAPFSPVHTARETFISCSVPTNPNHLFYV